MQSSINNTADPNCPGIDQYSSMRQQFCGVASIISYTETQHRPAHRIKYIYNPRRTPLNLFQQCATQHRHYKDAHQGYIFFALGYSVLQHGTTAYCNQSLKICGKRLVSKTNLPRILKQAGFQSHNLTSVLGICYSYDRSQTSIHLGLWSVCEVANAVFVTQIDWSVSATFSPVEVGNIISFCYIYIYLYLCTDLDLCYVHQFLAITRHHLCPDVEFCRQSTQSADYEAIKSGYSLCLAVMCICKGNASSKSYIVKTTSHPPESHQEQRFSVSGKEKSAAMAGYLRI